VFYHVGLVFDVFITVHTVLSVFLFFVFLRKHMTFEKYSNMNIFGLKLLKRSNFEAIKTLFFWKHTQKKGSCHEFNNYKCLRNFFNHFILLSFYKFGNPCLQLLSRREARLFVCKGVHPEPELFKRAYVAHDSGSSRDYTANTLGTCNLAFVFKTPNSVRALLSFLVLSYGLPSPLT